jgi:hypothetical protein
MLIEACLKQIIKMPNEGKEKRVDKPTQDTETSCSSNNQLKGLGSNYLAVVVKKIQQLASDK